MAEEEQEGGTCREEQIADEEGEGEEEGDTCREVQMAEDEQIVIEILT